MFVGIERFGVGRGGAKCIGLGGGGVRARVMVVAGLTEAPALVLLDVRAWGGVREGGRGFVWTEKPAEKAHKWKWKARRMRSREVKTWLREYERKAWKKRRN